MVVILGWGLALAACGSGDRPAPAPTAPSPAAPSVTAPPAAASAGGLATGAIVAAADAFLGALGDAEREAVLFDRGDRAQQQRWSNLPAQFYERRGLRIGDLDQGRADAFFALMRATLSDAGYARVTAIWAADDQLAEGGGGTYGRGNYWIAVIGEPSATEPWQWQFTGHHVTINAVVEGDRLSLTPAFLGSQPVVRPVRTVLDQAFALVTSLDEAARRRAVLGGEPIDLRLGAGQDCRTVEAEGLPGSAMTGAQRAAFLALITEFGGLGNDRSAAARLSELRADLPVTHFAWSGPLTAGSPAYFRITGPRVVVEYAPQAMGGDPADHVHGIYRDPTGDYGGTVC